MAFVHCTQGHQNTTGNRFCYLCGEQLAALPLGLKVPSVPHLPMMIAHRYRIQRELGQGGFGRTYLAEDTYRFNERCVLKQFAPQVGGASALQKAKELFEREAGVLYTLNHPQIPQFRELFQTNDGHQGHLFLVQDYVEGATYRQLLDLRRARGQCFSEAEIVHLFQQLLPVLQYIHSVGVIHRDISPENLIVRSPDQLPVLIDFGGVKQVAAVVASQMMPSESGSSVTRLGKVGYAPDEQLQLGQAHPYSDLYALAVTALVLLTGTEPPELLAHPTRSWQQQVSLSPSFRAILKRMLSHRVSDRYQTAQDIMQALSRSQRLPVPSPTSTPILPLSISPALAPGGMPTPVSTTPTHPYPPAQRQASGIGGLLLVMVLFSTFSATYLSRDRWLPPLQPLIDGLADLIPAQDHDSVAPSSQFTPEEQARKAALRSRLQALNIDSQFLITLTDQSFYQQYPDQQGRTLTSDSQDEKWRAQWDAIAADWLTQFEQLSPDARAKLGQFSASDRATWQRLVNALQISSSALYDLADARFLHWFPNHQSDDFQKFLGTPMGQVWQAIAADAVTLLQQETALESLTKAPGRYHNRLTHTLAPGEGRIYIANFNAGQTLTVDLHAPAKAMRLSIYVPSPNSELPFLLNDSRDLSWSGVLPQSGYYEVVVVATSPNPVDYQLTIRADR